MLQLFVQKLRNTMFREIPKPLGRWSINKCDTSISVVNYYANVDHCGSCDYEKKWLIVLGIPSNSFNQEKDNDDEVKKFCEVNFNITFPLSTITSVKGSNAHEIYKWAEKNHGKSAIPKWNFHKILINKEGKIIDTFASFTNPTSNKVLKELEKIL